MLISLQAIFLTSSTCRSPQIKMPHANGFTHGFGIGRIFLYLSKIRPLWQRVHARAAFLEIRPANASARRPRSSDIAHGFPARFSTASSKAPRTIEDLAGEENTDSSHIGEPIHSRTLDRKLWC